METKDNQIELSYYDLRQGYFRGCRGVLVWCPCGGPDRRMISVVGLPAHLHGSPRDAIHIYGSNLNNPSRTLPSQQTTAKEWLVPNFEKVTAVHINGHLGRA